MNRREGTRRLGRIFRKVQYNSCEMAHMTNLLATAEQLYQRQNLSLLPNDLQDVIFYMTQSLTQAAGVLLQLPESITAQANVVLARYWLVESRPLMANEFSVSIFPRQLSSFQPSLTQNLGCISRMHLPHRKAWSSATHSTRHLQCLRLPTLKLIFLYAREGRHSTHK